MLHKEIMHEGERLGGSTEIAVGSSYRVTHSRG